MMESAAAGTPRAKGPKILTKGDKVFRGIIYIPLAIFCSFNCDFIVSMVLETAMRKGKVIGAVVEVVTGIVAGLVYGFLGFRMAPGKRVSLYVLMGVAVLWSLMELRNWYDALHAVVFVASSVGMILWLRRRDAGRLEKQTPRS